MQSQRKFIWIVLFALLAHVANATPQTGAAEATPEGTVCDAQAMVADLGRVPSVDICDLQHSLQYPSSPAGPGVANPETIAAQGITCPRTTISGSEVPPVVSATIHALGDYFKTHESHSAEFTGRTAPTATRPPLNALASPHAPPARA